MNHKLLYIDIDWFITVESNLVTTSSETFAVYLLFFDKITFNVLRAGQNHEAYNCTVFSSFLILFLPLRAKYSSQHPVLEHHQFSSLVECERQSFHPFNL